MPRNFFTFVRLNDPFYLVAQAKFTSRTTGESQQLSIVFKMKFVTTIQVETSIYKLGVPFGGNLALSSAAQIINKESNSILPQGLSHLWICPESFDCSSLTETGTDIQITNDVLPTVSNGGVKYMQKYYFHVQLRSVYNIMRNLPYV